MGQFTPNIGIYIAANGETNYAEASASGMINIDQHDHSGGPNKGVPITSSGLSNFSVTYQKLATNVADNSTGIGTAGALGANQLSLLGILKNIFTLSTSGSNIGFITMNGSTVNARIFQNSSTITWSGGDGSSNPSASVNIAGLSPITVPNGGTGKTSLSPYDVLCGGTSSTGNVQQVSGEGTTGQVLTSNGASALPTWQAIPFPTQNILQATAVMTASQFRNLAGTPVQIVPPQGAGTVIIPVTAYGKVQISTTPFGGGSAVYFYWGSSLAAQSNVRFDSGTFDSSSSGYYLPTFVSPSTGVIPSASMENQGLYISVNSSNFTGGGTSTTATITVFYCVIQI